MIQSITWMHYAITIQVRSNGIGNFITSFDFLLTKMREFPNISSNS